MTDLVIDPKLKDWATPRQAEYIDAVNEHGSPNKAAEALGTDGGTVRAAIRTVERKASLAGYAPGHFDNGVAPGFRMGKVTVQRNAEGEIERTWERQSPEQRAMFEAIEAWIAGLAENIKPIQHSKFVGGVADSSLLAVYMIGDPHFGMYSWKAETGDDFDLDIAKTDLLAGMDRAVDAGPFTQTALIAEMGDFFHADNDKAVTPGHGNHLDVDTRWQKVMEVGLDAMVYLVRRALNKHEKVIVRLVKGNHDPHSSVALALALRAFFREEPRVVVDMSPSDFWFMRFGKVLIGLAHGDTCKARMLPGIMASDVPQDWGASEFRFFHHGHVHHDGSEEFPGCKVEWHQTLAGKDAWHAASGYRSGRSMKVIIYHDEDGELERHTVGIKAIHRSQG